MRIYDQETIQIFKTPFDTYPERSSAMLIIQYWRYFYFVKCFFFGVYIEWSLTLHPLTSTRYETENSFFLFGRSRCFF